MIIDIVLVNASGKGGLEEVITSFSKELINREYKVRVFQAHRPKHEEWIKTINEMYFFDPENKSNTIESYINGYKKMILEMGPPDIVLATHAPVLSYICYKAIEFLKDKRPSIISWIHGTPSYYGGEEYLRYADAHLAISKQIGRDIKKYVKEDKQVYYIANPVELKELTKIDTNSEKLKLVYVGRLDNKQKRIDVMFKSLSILTCDWELNIIGSGTDEEKLREISDELGISNNIIWHGWKEKPWEVLKSITALMLTSDEEGFGLVMVESLSRGIPVITTNTDGAKDIVIDGYNGWIFEKGDYIKLSEILKNINNNTQHISSKNCIDSVQRFSINNVIDNVEEILKVYDRCGKYQNIIYKTRKDIQLLIEKNMIEEAKDLINKYRSLVKDDIEIYNFIAFIDATEGNYIKAYNLLKNGIKKYEANIDAIFNLIYLSEIIGKRNETLRYLNYILANVNDDKLIKEAELNLGTIYKDIKSKHIKKKLTIDIVVYSLSGRGGTEKAISTIEESLRKRGHRVRIFQAYKTQHIEWEESFDEIYTYGTSDKLENDTLDSLSVGYREKISKLGKPDIILATHQPILSAICRLAIGKQYEQPPKIISWLHSDPKLMGAIEALKYSDGHIAISKYIFNDINKITDSYNICLSGNPIKFNFGNRINVDKDRLNLIYIGRLENSFKRIDVLLKALSLLDKEWQLSIVGSGEHEEDLKRLAQELGIQQNIKWFGWQQKPWDLIKSATALVLPSDSEAFPLVILESLQRGLPVIISNCDGPKDIVDNYRNGIIFEKGNYNQLSQIFKDILDKKIQLPNSEECIKSVEKYNVDRVVDQIESYLLSQILD